MKKEDIRGPAYAPITAIEDVTAEMLGYIRERMRLTPSQVQLLEPVCRRAVHQIARKMEIQPLIHSSELRKALRIGPGRAAEAWINREFGPGWIVRQGKGAPTMIAMCRASFFALLDEWKAQKAKRKDAAKVKEMAKTSPGYGSPDTYTRPAPKKAVKVPEKAPPRLSINGKRIGRPPKKEKAA